MGESSFRFKQFTVDQAVTPMKTGTDAVLLGAWARMPDLSHCALDIGTGTGVIALMLAQRFPHMKIAGIDIEAEAIVEAAQNFARSPWNDRMEAVCASVQTYKSIHQVDGIVCNPPYFTSDVRSPDAGRDRARSTVSLSFEELTNAVLRLLKPSGTFSMILPVTEMARFRAVAMGRLFATRITQVHTTAAKQASRVLTEFHRNDSLFLGDSAPALECDRLVLTENGAPTEQYRTLTRDFYLDF